MSIERNRADFARSVIEHPLFEEVIGEFRERASSIMLDSALEDEAIRDNAYRTYKGAEDFFGLLHAYIANDSKSKAEEEASRSKIITEERLKGSRDAAILELK